MLAQSQFSSWSQFVSFYTDAEKFPLVLIIGVLLVGFIVMFWLSIRDSNRATKATNFGSQMATHVASMSDTLAVTKGQNNALKTEVEFLKEELQRMQEEKNHYQHLYEESHKWAMDVVDRSLNSLSPRVLT